MITDDRLYDIEKDLEAAPEFFRSILDILNISENKELYEDLEAAPEFFREMMEIVQELIERRRAAGASYPDTCQQQPSDGQLSLKDSIAFDEYKAKLRNIIPEAGPKWSRRKRGIWEQHN